MEITKPDVWMPLYIGDYLADTAHLDATQHGCYLLWLMHYWRNGPLANDLKQLIRIGALEGSEAPETAQKLLKSFFILGRDGLWRQKRQDKERAKWLEKKVTAQEKAKKAAKKRWDAPSNAPSNASGNQQAMLEQCPSSLPSPLPLSKPKPSADPVTTRAKSKGDFASVSALFKSGFSLTPSTLPKTKAQMIAQGYTFSNGAPCKGCGEPIEWWSSPKGARLPMNPMSEDPSGAIVHLETCSASSEFRKAN